MASTGAAAHTVIRLNMSALSLKWGDALSMVLPGLVALLAVGPYVPTLNSWLSNLAEAKLGVLAALAVSAMAAGGMLEAITRVLWAELFNKFRRVRVDALSVLGENHDYLDLYERGVQVAYKWTTFYTNMGTAMAMVLMSRLHQGPEIFSVINVLISAMTGILFRAAWVQWRIYANYVEKVFGDKANAKKRSTRGDALAHDESNAGNSS